jgi:hypothetical protein
MTQYSLCWWLLSVVSELFWRQLFFRVFFFFNDTATTEIYTIVFAYVGASLSVVLLLYVYNQPMLNLLSLEDIATEIVRTLCSGIGLVLAVPFTTAIAVALVPPRAASAEGEPASAELPEDDAAKVEWLRTLRTVESPLFPVADARTTGERA